MNDGDPNPVFRKATVRFFGTFDEEIRHRFGQQRDRAGSLVVTIRDDRIEVAFDELDHVYVALIQAASS